MTLTFDPKQRFIVFFLSYDAALGDDIKPCIKIDKPLVVYVIR